MKVELVQLLEVNSQVCPCCEPAPLEIVHNECRLQVKLHSFCEFTLLACAAPLYCE